MKFFASRLQYALLTVLIGLFGAYPLTAQPRQTQRPIDLEMVFYQSAHWKYVLYGVRDARETFEDIRLQAVMPGNMTARSHNQAIEAALGSNPRGLAVTVVHAQDQRETLERAAAQVPLVTFDWDGPRGLSRTFVGHDEFGHGKLAAELILRAADQDTPVHLFTEVGHPWPDLRVRGIRNGLEGSGVSVTAVHDKGQDHDKTKQQVQQVLAASDGPLVLIGVWYQNGGAILQAVRDAGRQHNVKVVCFGIAPLVKEGIEQGHIVGCVVQDHHRLTVEAVRVLRAHVLGEDPETTHRGAHAVRGGIVDAQNLEAYTDYQRSILENEDGVDFFPFDDNTERDDAQNAD
ncbi:MAG: substrate-binding domain-containing protein [Planctomycetota bacterium]